MMVKAVQLPPPPPEAAKVVEVWYCRGNPPAVPEQLRRSTLAHSHAHLADVEVFSDTTAVPELLSRVYAHMQSEQWSPNGEARPLIEGRGLSHTSMSPGDVLGYQGRYYVVIDAGFEEVDGEAQRDV